MLHQTMIFLKRSMRWLSKNADIAFFAIFIVSFPFSIRKVIVLSESGVFNEFTSISIFASDVFLVVTLLCYGIIQRHKISKSSIISCWTTWKEQQRRTRWPVVFLVGLVVLLGFSSLRADNPMLAWVKFLRVAFLVALFFYIQARFFIGCNSSASGAKRSASKVDIKPYLAILCGIGVFNVFIGLLQTYMGSSLNLTLLRESVLLLENYGVAKGFIGDALFLRSYGFFSHPNVLAAFLFACLFFCILMGMNMRKQQHGDCSTWNSEAQEDEEMSQKKPMFHVEQLETMSFVLLAVVLLAGLFATFSRSTIIAVGLMTLFLIGTHLKRGAFYLLITLFGISVVYYSAGTQSISERGWYSDIANIMIQEHPFLGVGPGNFVQNMQEFATYTLKEWQFQPVHNVFHLIWAEVGFVGFALFTIFFITLFHVEHSNGTKGANRTREFLEQSISRTQSLANGYLLSVLFLIFFDHYYWDIVPGMYIFWFSLAVTQLTIPKS